MTLELKNIIETNVHNKSKLSLYKLLLSIKQLYTSNNKEHFSYKGGCGGHGCMLIEVFKRKAGLGYRLMASCYLLFKTVIRSIKELKSKATKITIILYALLRMWS